MIKFIKGGMKGFDPLIYEWDEPVVREYCGKTIYGRKTKGFGEESFEYAGKFYNPSPWTQPMKYIKWNTESLVKAQIGKKVDFNFCLCGLYEEDGKGIPHHSDTVPTLDDIVVSLSFGAPRIFEWREYHYDIKKETNTSETHIDLEGNATITHYLLEDGDVLIFDGASQMTSTHAVLDLVGARDRVNLTFRTGINNVKH